MIRHLLENGIHILTDPTFGAILRGAWAGGSLEFKHGAYKMVQRLVVPAVHAASVAAITNAAEDLNDETPMNNNFMGSPRAWSPADDDRVALSPDRWQRLRNLP
jgi:hypothetical protein